MTEAQEEAFSLDGVSLTVCSLAVRNAGNVWLRFGDFEVIDQNNDGVISRCECSTSVVVLLALLRAKHSALTYLCFGQRALPIQRAYKQVHLIASRFAQAHLVGADTASLKLSGMNCGKR